MTLIPNTTRLPTEPVSSEADGGLSPVAPPRIESRAKATEVEPGTAAGTGPRKTINHRAGLRVGGAVPRMAAEGEQTGNSLSRSHVSPRISTGGK